MPNELHRAIYDPLLENLVTRSGVSRDALGRVLGRVMVVAPDDVPRADIAKGTMLARPSALNPAAVSKAVSAMIAHGLLSEEPMRADEQRAGRPIKPLSLGSDQWGLMGISVIHSGDRPVALTGVITTLRLDEARDVLFEDTSELPPDAMFADLAMLIKQFVKDLEKKLHKHEGRPKGSRRQLLGIGIQVAAPVFAGKIVGGTHMGIPADESFDLAGPLQDALKIPVVVDNDVNVLAVRELYRHTYPERDLALVVVFDDGVGAALILDGHVYRGGRGMAGEPGHQSVKPLETPCHLSQLDQVVKECHCGQENHVDCFAVPKRLESQLDLDSFIAAADSVARDQNNDLTPAGWVFRRGGDALGQGIAAMINVVNPSRVVVMLRSELASAQPSDKTAASEYLAALEEAIDIYSFNHGAHSARAGEDHLTIIGIDPERTAHTGALCAAARALDNFIQHARGRDECENS